MGGEFTQEELEILGEETPDTEPENPSEGSEDTGESEETEEKTEETPESEEEEEESETEQDEAEGEKDDEKSKGPVPYDRFSKVYGEKKELERKLELFRKDPEEYFRQYPDEKPTGEQSETTVETPEETNIPTFGEAGSLVVQGGEHDGLTLRQVYEKDPFVAQDIYMQYREGLLSKQREEQETNERLKQESDREVNSFASERAKELFDKDMENLSEKEAAQIDKEINETLIWMSQTRRGWGNLKDAYVLKNLDKIIGDATKKGASGLVNHLTKPTSSSISSKRTSSETSMNNYLSMDQNQLATMVDNMSEREFLNFKKNAPPALREKFPGLDWD